jgi:large subunit ribosomal protein L23
MAATEEKQGGIRLEPHQIVLRPLVTEKGTDASTELNQYAFEVNAKATKEEIRDAVQKLFEVRVVKVRTQNRRGKSRRYRFKMGRTADWKRALVTLHPEDRIEFF